MTVVIGYIPGEYGEAALTAGIDEARRRHTGIVVVNASKGDALVDKKYLGEGALAELQERLREVGVPHEVRQEVATDVAESVLGVARETNAEVIVIGLRPRTPVGKMIMGSVAQRVLLDAPCPVLSVRPD